MSGPEHAESTGVTTPERTGGQGEAIDDVSRLARPSRRRLTLWAVGGVALVFVALSVVMATGLDSTGDYTGTALLGKPAPDPELVDLDGEPVSLASLRGRAVIVNFFNSWCVPCKEEEPALRAFYAAHRDDPDFAMVGIVRDDTESAIREWAASRDVGWTVAFDPGAQASVEFATTGQPETYAITPSGVVAGRHLSRATIEDLEALLAAARGEAGGRSR